jgi:hypothetical protein
MKKTAAPQTLVNAKSAITQGQEQGKGQAREKGQPTELNEM